MAHREMALAGRIERLGSLAPKRILRRDDLQPGDHICTDRNKRVYYHHGIYVGDGRVIHFTKVSARRHAQEKDICRHIEGAVDVTAHPTRGVRLICLDCFLRSHSLNRVEYGLRKPVTSPVAYLGGSSRGESLCDDAETVVERAWERLKRDDFGEYSLLWKNCETFAYLCKTGEDYPFGSKQTQRLCEFFLDWMEEPIVVGHESHHFGHFFDHFRGLHFHARRSAGELVTAEAGCQGVATEALLPPMEKPIYPWHFHF